jgi:hypothetical protein
MSNQNNGKSKTRSQGQRPGQQKKQQSKAAQGPKKQGQGGMRAPKRQSSVSAAYATGQSGKAPVIAMSKDSCRVVHRELLGNVSGTGTAAFTTSSTFALNPGVSSTFPWLANMAQNWETYRVNRMKVCYYTRTGSNTAGSVILVPDYDASDSTPISEQTASSYEDVQEDAPWKDIECVLRPAAMHNVGPRKFVRSGALSANQDIKLYDVGNMFIFTVDSATAASWGKLWIEYDITFYTPQLFPGGSNFSQIATLAATVGTDATHLMGTSNVISGNLLISGTGNVLTAPNLIVGGRYFVSLSLIGTVITADALASVVGFAGDTNGFANCINSTATASSIMATVTATATTGTLTFSASATTITASDLIFGLIPAQSGF